MTPEEQRITLAEACGWIPEVRKVEIPEADFVHVETFWKRGDKNCRGPWLPDYLNDLNAMSDALMSQSKAFRLRFETIMDNHCSDIGKLWCELEAEEFAEIFLQVKRE